MNLALSALTLLVLLTPGYFATQSYLGQIGRTGTSDAAASDGIPVAWLKALIVAPLIHAFAVWTVSFLPVPQPDLNSALALLAGADFKANESLYLAVSQNGYWILLYFSMLNVASAIGGRLLHGFVRAKQLDVRYPLLRFPNDWHYTLSGELQVIPPSAVLVDVTIEFGDETYIYSGVLTKWTVGDNGKLDRLHLGAVVRRKLDETELREISAEDFVVWCEDIKTLNIHYVQISTVS